MVDVYLCMNPVIWLISYLNGNYVICFFYCFGSFSLPCTRNISIDFENKCCIVLCIFFRLHVLDCFSSGHGGFLWPGLNSPVLKDGALQSVSQRGKAEQQEVQAELGTETECTCRTYLQTGHADIQNEHEYDYRHTNILPHLHLY